MTRKEHLTYNKMKFFAILCENFISFGLNKALDEVKKSKGAVDKSKKSNDMNFYDLLVVSLFNLYREPYIYLFYTYVQNLFFKIFDIYCKISNISISDLKRQYYDKYDKKLIKKICEKITKKNYAVTYEKKNNKTKFEILFLGNLNSFLKNIPADENFSNIVTVYAINNDKDNTINLTILYRDEAVVHTLYSNNYNSYNYLFDINTDNISVDYYFNLSENIYNLVKTYYKNEKKQHCHICKPSYSDLCDIKNINKTTERKKSCPTCKKIFKNLNYYTNIRTDHIKEKVLKIYAQNLSTKETIDKRASYILNDLLKNVKLLKNKNNKKSQEQIKDLLLLDTLKTLIKDHFSNY